MKALAVALVAVVAIACMGGNSGGFGVQAKPMKYMCDMCESNFFHCVMKCSMEEYMTRHSFNRKRIYVGQPRHRPRKTQLDRVFERYMHSTGHEHV